MIQDYYRTRYGIASVFIPVRRRPARAGGPRDARPPGPRARAIRPLRLAARAREQRARRSSRAYRDVRGNVAARRRGRRAVRRRVHRAAARRGRSARPHARAPSTARATGSCSPTPPSTSRRRRSAARIRRSSRPWATAGSSATTRRPRTRRSPAARPCRSTPADPAIADAAAAAGSWMIRPATPYGKRGPGQRTRERYRWDDVVDRYEAVLEGRGRHP